MNREKKKIDIIGILCYIGIFLLIILIALPPVLRALIKTEKEPEVIYPKVIVLTCEGSLDTEYKKKVVTTYTDSVVTKIDWVYDKVIQEDDNKTEEALPQTEDIPKVEPVEIATLRNIGNIMITEENNIINMTALKNVIETYRNTSLSEYTQELTLQKQKYETAQLICTIKEIEI